MPDAPRQRGSLPPPVLAALDHKLESEGEVLEALLQALARNQLPSDLWQRLFDAARRDNRGAELAGAFESLLQDKRMKTLPAAVVGELTYQTAVFYGEGMGDEGGAIGH